jgi:putative methyltransferase (TIGR04325 family)
MTKTGMLRSLAPPALVRLAARWSGRSLRFDRVPGDDWALALQRSSGYDAEQILERVLAATREVVAGRAAFERDSVLFHDPELPMHLLAPLLRCALQAGGMLEVVDFGGSLGSTYRQCRAFLEPVAQLRWHIIEQAHFVASGRAEFASPELHFHRSLAELGTLETPPLVLASAVLHYLEDPRRVLDGLMALPCRMLIIDRTPLSDLAEHQLCIQKVPRRIYPASYPCWIFSRRRLLDQFDPSWRLLGEFPALDGIGWVDGGTAFQFKGLILEKRP